LAEVSPKTLAANTKNKMVGRNMRRRYLMKPNEGKISTQIGSVGDEIYSGGLMTADLYLQAGF
jgi:hypothetical protein